MALAGIGISGVWMVLDKLLGRMVMDVMVRLIIWLILRKWGKLFSRRNVGVFEEEHPSKGLIQKLAWW